MSEGLKRTKSRRPPPAFVERLSEARPRHGSVERRDSGSRRSSVSHGASTDSTREEIQVDSAREEVQVLDTLLNFRVSHTDDRNDTAHAVRESLPMSSAQDKNSAEVLPGKVHQLESQLREMHLKYREYAHENDDLNDRCHSALMEISACENRVNTLTEEKAELETEKFALLHTKKMLEATILRNDNEIKDILERLKDAETAVANAVEKMEDLCRQLREVVDDDILELPKPRNRLHSCTAVIDDELKRLTTAVDGARAQIINAKASLESLRYEEAGLKNENGRLQIALTATQKHTMDLQSRQQGLTDKILQSSLDIAKVMNLTQDLSGDTLESGIEFLSKNLTAMLDTLRNHAALEIQNRRLSLLSEKQTEELAAMAQKVQDLDTALRSSERLILQLKAELESREQVPAPPSSSFVVPAVAASATTLAALGLVAMLHRNGKK